MSGFELANSCEKCAESGPIFAVISNLCIFPAFILLIIARSRVKFVPCVTVMSLGIAQDLPSDDRQSYKNTDLPTVQRFPRSKIIFDKGIVSEKKNDSSQRKRRYNFNHEAENQIDAPSSSLRDLD